jgi:hypothetical protein
MLQKSRQEGLNGDTEEALALPARSPALRDEGRAESFGCQAPRFIAFAGLHFR